MANLTCCQGSYSSTRRKADVATTLFTVDIFTERDPTFTETSQKIHWLLCFLFAFEKRRTTAFQVIKAPNKQALFAKPGSDIYQIDYPSYHACAKDGMWTLGQSKPIAL